MSINRFKELPRWQRLAPVCIVLLLTAVVKGPFLNGAQPASTVPAGNADANAEEPFLKQNAAAMNKMMADMDVKPTGDVDRDFVAMMVPHHQGAIDMAKAVLLYGKNQQVRRLAQEIIVTQQDEIAAMRLAVGDPMPLSAAPSASPKPPPAKPATTNTMGPMNHSTPMK